MIYLGKNIILLYNITMVKTSIKVNNKIEYEFEHNITKDCIQKYKFVERNTKQIYRPRDYQYISTDIVDGNIIHHVKKHINHNTTMVYIENWPQWNEEVLKNWDNKVKDIDIALLAFAMPKRYIDDDTSYLCPGLIAPLPVMPGYWGDWRDSKTEHAHDKFITRLKEKNKNLKILLSVGGATMGCCPSIDGYNNLTINYWAEQAKLIVEVDKDAKELYENGENVRVRDRIIHLISEDIVALVQKPNIQSKKNSEDSLQYQKIYRLENNRNVYSDKYSTSELTIAQDQIHVGRNDFDAYDIHHPEYFKATDEEYNGPQYDGVDFDYEVDFNFENTYEALRRRAKLSRDKDDKDVLGPPAFNDELATDLSNIVIRLMKAVDTKLNVHHKKEHEQRKLISTVPFISHFDKPNKFNVGLKEIQNSVDIVGVQFYNSGPFFVPTTIEETGHTSYGICNTLGQDQFKNILQNIHNSIGLDKTIILLDNLPEEVNGNNPTIGDGGEVCNKSWARSKYVMEVTNSANEKIHLIRDAKCLLGGSWDNLDTPANKLQRKSIRSDSEIDMGDDKLIRNRPLIEVSEIIRSLNKLAMDIKHGDSSVDIINKLEFLGMGYWAMDSNPNSLNLVKLLKEDMNNLNYSVKDTFNYCNDIVPNNLLDYHNTASGEDILQLSQKKYGCPLMPNPYTEPRNLPNITGTISASELKKIHEQAIGKGRETYDLIIEEKCHIYQVACEEAKTSILYDPDNGCGHTKGSTKIAALDGKSIKYDCKASQVREACRMPCVKFAGFLEAQERAEQITGQKGGYCDLLKDAYCGEGSNWDTCSIHQGSGPICKQICGPNMPNVDGEGKLFMNCSESERGCSATKKCTKLPFSELKKNGHDYCWAIQDAYGCVGNDECVYQKTEDGVCQQACAAIDNGSKLLGDETETFINCDNKCS